ncbi:MAG: hypothetical protein Q9207_006706 [Kuettlingeria erythrocarpa]
MTTKEVPTALVLEWDAVAIRVRCPFCSRRHRHYHRPALSSDGIRTFTVGTRRLHCSLTGHSEEYRLQYPFEVEEEHTSWKIDKLNWKFVTVGLQDDDEDNCACTSEVGGGVHHLDQQIQLAIQKSNTRAGFATELEEVHLEHLIDLAIEDYHEELIREEMQDRLGMAFLFHCAYNELQDVQLFMATYDENFLAASDKAGNHGVARAATEGNLEVLQWLHEQGCDVNKRNRRGCTPLMAASLWGRLLAVDYLLKHGADATLEDHGGRTALDLALPSECNTNERRTHAPRYCEPPEADTYPSSIAFREGQRSAPGLILNPATSSHNQRVDYNTLYKSYDISDESKAMGWLDRGRLFPLVSTMSGYTQSESGNTTLDNRYWTNQVLILARKLDVKVEKSYASHVEKQLLAFYVAQHVLLDAEDHKQRSRGEDMYLSHVKPPKPPAAVIVVSKERVCDGCERFIDEVRELIQVDIVMECIKM